MGGGRKGLKVPFARLTIMIRELLFWLPGAPRMPWLESLAKSVPWLPFANTKSDSGSVRLKAGVLGRVGRRRLEEWALDDVAVPVEHQQVRRERVGLLELASPDGSSPVRMNAIPVGKSRPFAKTSIL